MVQIPQDEVTQEDLAAWYKKAEELSKLKVEEMLLRKRIFKHFFPEPREGTNKVELGGGYELSVTHVIDRKIDPALLLALQGQFQQAEIPLDRLIKMEPKLQVKNYKELEEEKRILFDQVLEIKEGSPSSMKIDMPAKLKKAQAAAQENGVPFQ